MSKTPIHEFYPDGYGHGECRTCGLVEALHHEPYATMERLKAELEEARYRARGVVEWMKQYRDSRSDGRDSEAIDKMIDEWLLHRAALTGQDEPVSSPLELCRVCGALSSGSIWADYDYECPKCNNMWNRGEGAW